MGDGLETADDNIDGVAILQFAAAAGLLCTAVACLTAWIAGVSMNAFPSWLEAWATVTAVCAAVVAGMYAARAFGLERARDVERDRDRRAAQASLVVAWWGRNASGQEGVILRNASALPVVDVGIYVNRKDAFDESFTMGPYDSVLGPSATEWVPPSLDSLRFLEELGSDEKPEVRLVFTDAAGWRWGRTPSGALREPARVVDLDDPV